MLGTLIALGIAGAAGWAALSRKKSKKEDKAYENKSRKIKKHEKKDLELSDGQVEQLKEISNKKIASKKSKRNKKVKINIDTKAEKAATKKRKTKKEDNEFLEAESKIITIENDYLNDIEERYVSNSELKFLRKLIEKTYDSLGKYADKIDTKKHIRFFQILGGDFDRKIHNDKFLEHETKIQSKYFEQFSEHGLTDKQLEAVLTDEDAVLVNAGAGTGKTKTIESKVLYLHNVKKIPLDEILVITFAKKSQKDMMKRIIESLKKSGVEVTENDLADTVSTFHAFGKRILDEYDEKNGVVYEPGKKIGKGKVGRKVITVEDEGNPLGQIVKKILDEMKTGDIKDELIQYLTYFSRPELQVHDYDSRGQYYENAKKTYLSLLKQPENGYSYHVKSYGELMIANYFAMHGIEALYEPKDYFYTQVVKKKKKRKIDENGNISYESVEEVEEHKKSYKPDFLIPEVVDENGNKIREKIYIEYFGVDKVGNTAPYIDNKDYVEKMNNKIDQHTKSNNILIDLRYADLQDGVDALLGKLEAQLKSYGVEIKEFDYDEKFKVLGDEEGTFEQLLKTFLALFKESDDTIEALREKAKIIDPANYERMQSFLNIFTVFLEKYDSELKSNGYMDFGDMIYEAKKYLSSGAVERKYKYILVDEFQDISEARAGLINQLIEDPYTTRLFCVGDDWQSIYNFSGSNINIFLKFDSYFGYTHYITLDKTFRFNQGISDVSSLFVMMNPEQNRKTLTALDTLVKGRFEIYQKEPARHIENEESLYSTHYRTYERIFRSMLDDFIQNFSEDNENEYEDGFCQISILYLARYNFDKLLEKGKSTFLTYLQSEYSLILPEGDDDFFTVKVEYQGYKFHIKLTPYTIHKSKGLQATYVFVDFVNQKDRGYSFPSNFTDDPLLYLVINDDKKGYPNAEERRLFYVAITRGIKKVYLCYEKNIESGFLKDLLKVGKQVKKSVINVTKDDQTGESISLIGKYDAPKCVQCKTGYITPSNESFNKDPKFKSFYCSNIWMGCDATYVEYKGKRYLSPYCPNGCGDRMLLKKSGNSTDYFWGCQNFTLTGCRGNRRLEEAKVVEDTIRDEDFEAAVTEIDDIDGGIISDLSTYEYNNISDDVVVLDEESEFEKLKNLKEEIITTKVYANNGQRRTDDELKMLKDMVYDGKSIEEMADILQRKPSAIVGKLPGPSISNDLLVSILNCEEISSLAFQTLNDLNEYQAKILGAFKGDSMYFSVLDHLDKGVAAQLSKFNGSRLYLNGVKHLSVLDAAYLSKFGGEILSLQGLQSIEEGGAEKLKEFTGTLMLPNALKFVKEGEKDESNKNTKIDISRIIPFISPELKKERKEKVKTLSSDNKVVYFKIRSILLKANSEMGKRVDCNIPIIIENKPQTKEALINDLGISEEEFEQCGDKLLEFIKNNV